MATTNPFITASITLGRELAEVTERLRSCTVLVQGEYGVGSGVVWRPEGVIVTNAHVVSAPWCSVMLPDRRTLRAELVSRDPRRDLAVLRVQAAGLPSAQWREPSSLRPGEMVVAVGNPMGVMGALALGVVSATPSTGDAFIRADIRLARGNSGGPLADTEARVVGINSMIVGGFGIAVTSTAVEELVRESSARVA